MKTMKKSAGFTLIELVISATMSAVVIFAISGIVIFVTTTLSTSSVERNLQMDMNLLTDQIVNGVIESSEDFAYGLRSAASYAIASTDRVDFTDILGVTRSFIASSSDLIYDSPTQSPAQAVLYTAPAGATFRGVFDYLSIDPDWVYVKMSVTQTVNGKVLVGSVDTSVHLRNAPRE